MKPHTLVALAVLALILAPSRSAAQVRTPPTTAPSGLSVVPVPPPPPRTRASRTPSPAAAPAARGNPQGSTARSAPSTELPEFDYDAARRGFDPLRSLTPSPRLPEAIAAEPANEPGELLVLWESEAAADRGIEEIADRFQIDAAQRIALPHLGRVLGVYRLASMVAAADLKTRLTLSHSDWIVDYNSRYVLLGEPRLYATAKIGLVSPSRPARPVRIGLLDTAVAPIPALRHAAVMQRDFVTRGTAAASAHGTAIAALLLGEDAAAGFTGIARGCTLSVAQVVRAGAQETTNVRLLLQGADWLVGARVELINASLGGPPNRLVHALTQQLAEDGVVLIAAAGNSGPEAPAVYPAAYDAVLAVTATDALDRVYAQANRGHYIDLSAPGVDLWVPGETSGHYVTGTSFAAALVTGAVALHLSTQPANVTGAGLQTRLCAGARDLGAAGRDPVFGCGLVQVRTAAAQGDL